MTPDIIFVIAVLFLGFIMFIFELFSIDVTAMILLTILFVLGYLTPQEALSGFSNPAVITIAFLFIISHALQKTQILEYLIVRVRRLADRSIILGRAVYLFTIGIASAVVNNTAIVAIFMPVSIRLSQKYKMSPSKMLIPLSYAAILGGTLTLVGTSTNLLVNSIYILEPGTKPMGMFEFTKYGMILMFIGLCYILFIAPMLLPSRTSTSSLTKSYHLGGYLTEMRVTKESPLPQVALLFIGLYFVIPKSNINGISSSNGVSPLIKPRPLTSISLCTNLVQSTNVFFLIFLEPAVP